MVDRIFRNSGLFVTVLLAGSLAFHGVSYAEEGVQAPGAAPTAVSGEAPNPELQAMSDTDIVWLTVSAVRLQRQYIVASAMRLSPDESMAFWPVYEEYWNEMGPLRDRLWQLTGLFVAERESLTDERANAMINDYLDIRQQEFIIKQKYVERFKAALPALKVLRYYQIENKLDSILQYETSRRVPLADVKAPSDI